ncbi:hypothetical protein [Neptunicella sp. SCSIO 80796]|uniref:hypothetical protein n=1 Tax=Neptunicella plasticusilytica TaxID=3117012 RepID=UPI003A4D327E
MNAIKTDEWQHKIKANSVKLAYWTAAWVLSMAVATFAPKYVWAGNETLTIVAIAVNAFFGIGMIIANKNHLRSLDEMQQKIQLEAMGISLGMAVVGGLVYSNLDINNVISGDAEIGFLVIAIGLTYLASIFIGMRKYQ